MDNPPEVLLDTPDDTQYESQRQTFNRRFHKRPAAIVLCKNAEQVSHVVTVAAANPDYPLRVKSGGGHDHEAECSITDGIVIDFSEMKEFHIDKEAMTLTVTPGLQFRDVIPHLDAANVSIPHGTCESVGIFGFTLGGGWGPWTRLHGMCCEHLVGATIVLGDGSIRKLKASEEKDRELLWALRGGGGFSFGILTQMVIKVFEQPPHTLRFILSWQRPHDGLLGMTQHPLPPAIKILEAWEKVIAPDQNKQLIGTNLQIMAIPEDEKSIQESVHECVFYGYYAGSNEELTADVNRWFEGLPWTGLKIVTSDEVSQHSFSSWDRISTSNEKLRWAGKQLQHFPPDVDHPAPHKLTSRLVQEEGLGQEGRENLIKSLRSKLISKEGIKAHLHTYVTLGAISGHFYNEVYDYPDYPNGSSFPYKKRPYTIQYQVWWDETDDDKEKGAEFHVYNYVNDALDWITECRTNDFPQTNGSFISFKDSGVPTRQYFLDSYDRLRDIKERYCKDENNLFRSRKTIP